MVDQSTGHKSEKMYVESRTEWKADYQLHVTTNLTTLRQLLKIGHVGKGVCTYAFECLKPQLVLIVVYFL